jgi:hypothetical protein
LSCWQTLAKRTQSADDLCRLAALVVKQETTYGFTTTICPGAPVIVLG